MALNCMLDFVGLSYAGCNATASLSGLYLDQLPGIELKQASEIASQDQITSSGLWRDLQNTAIDSFSDDVITELDKRFQLRQIVQAVDLGNIIDTTTLTTYSPTSSISNGIIIELYQQGNQCIGSVLSSIYIQELNFYWYGSTASPNFNVSFINADTLTTEHTISVNNVVNGWNNVWVDYTFVSKRLIITVNGNFTNYVNLDISEFFLDNFTGVGSYNWNFSNGWLNFNYNNSCGINSRLNGVSYDTTNPSNPVSSTNTFGLSVVFSTKCSWDLVVCNNKRQFATLWQYKLAITFFDYLINSSRLNRYTTIKLDQAMKLQESYISKYKEKLKVVMTSLNFNPNDGCLQSNDYLIWREVRL